MSSVNFLEKLLDGVTVEWLPLGNLAEIYGGLTGKSKSDFEQGNANYITYKNIFSNIVDKSFSLKRIIGPESDASYALFPKSSNSILSKLINF